MGLVFTVLQRGTGVYSATTWDWCLQCYNVGLVFIVLQRGTVFTVLQRGTGVYSATTWDWCL